MKKIEHYNWKLDFESKKGKKYLIDERDKSTIDDFNNKNKKNENFIIRTDLYPEGCIGNPHEAKVILLALNPGYVDESEANNEHNWYKEHGNELEIILRDNLSHNVKNFPYYYFNDKFKDFSPGHDWIGKRTKELRNFLSENCGVSAEQFSKRIAMIQFFPYHSKKFKDVSTDYLDVQKYHFRLVLKAMKDEKLIVCMRSLKKWDKALSTITDGKEKLSINDKEKLGKYPNLIQLKNYRSPYITTGNMKAGEKDFMKIIKALKS